MVNGPALLFCPGDRPDRYGKAFSAADSVILDLEDAVMISAKQDAQEALMRSNLDPALTIVRINPVVTSEFQQDLDALRRTQYRIVMLPKAETPADVLHLIGFEVIALCETPLGIRNADLLAELDEVVALTSGAEDLTFGLGGTASRFSDGRFRDFVRYARSRVLIAAASEGKSAYDTVHLDITDDDGLRKEAEDAMASGFAGAMCIHPSQVDIVRQAFRPSKESIDWANAILAAASRSENGVFTYGGLMVDEPVLRQARRILATSGGSAS